MQLMRPRAGASWSIAAVSCVVVLLCAAARALADGSVSAGASLFREQGGPLHMDVIMPSANVAVDVAEPLQLRVGWMADIVSGASVAVVDAPAEKVDAISTATLSDTRHVFSGGLTLRDTQGSVDVAYAHAFENDYRSDSFSVTARSELWNRNTGVEIGYSRAFDRVCDVAGTFEPVAKPRLESSQGCFSDTKTRATRELEIHNLTAGFTQVWTPLFTTRVGVLAQMLHGFQVNPYRAVRIGKTAAQEHAPNERARYALSASGRYWLAPLSAALGLEARVYRDTWGISSLSGELSYDQKLFGDVRLRLRLRYYTQGRAAFYSDDYKLAPKGRYFTGDRELSAMRSALFGLAFRWHLPTDSNGRLMGFLSSFTLVLKGDLLRSFFDDFHYDRAEVPNTLAQLISLELRATM
jgi:hypothetical protein